MLIHGIKEKSIFTLASLKLIHTYLKWKGILKTISIDHFIAHCDFSMDTIARNVILEKYGTKTYYYMDSASFGCFHAREGGKPKIRSLIGFIYYDYFVSWSQRVSEYFKQSHCQIKNYVDVGCLWAEHIRLFQEGTIATSFKKDLYAKGYKDDLKLIAAFDSSYLEGTGSNYDEAIRFLKDMLRLLDEDPNIFIVLKEKKSRDPIKQRTHQWRDVVAAYEKFENHPRAVCLQHKCNASEIIACSDLILTVPFSTPTFEALAARKRAIWHDANNKYRGVYFDRVEGLVTHGYEELKERIHQLLYSLSQEEYDHYLDHSIKGTVESYLDGKAITRFRNLFNDSSQKINSKISQVNTKSPGYV